MMRLSIITINYNNAEGLRKTLASVASQTFRDFEHIIVDGGSTDESVEIIEAYASDVARKASSCVPTGGDGGYAAMCGKGSTLAEGAQPLAQQDTTSPKDTQPHKVRWLSETDNGIYDAMNKGIEIALGKRTVNSFNRSELVEDKKMIGRTGVGSEYVLFLNSGDYLIDTNVLQMVNDTNMQADVCYFDAIFTKQGEPYLTRTYPDSLSLRFFLSDSLCHQATFYQLSALSEYEGYDEQYKLIGDWALNVKLIVLNNCSIQHYPSVTTCYEIGGLSWTDEGRQRCEDEKNIFLQANISSKILADYHYWTTVETSDWYRRIVRIKSRKIRKILLGLIKLLNRLDK